MKKIIFSIPFLFLILTSCNNHDESTEEINDLKAFNLKGDVKSVQERSYEFAGGIKGMPKRENSATYDMDLEFNKSHQLISQKRLLPNGKPFENKTFEHKNKMLLQEEFLPNDVIFRTKYTWDNDNNTIISKRDKDGKQLHKTVNTFEIGNLTQKRIFDQNDELVERFTYKNDANGNIIEDIKFNKYGEIMYKNNYSYDKENRKVQEARADRSNKLAYKIQTVYKDSLLSEINSYDSIGNLEYSQKMLYNPKGKLSTIFKHDFHIEEKTKEIYEHDENGNETLWKLYSGDKPNLAIISQYDSQNNIILYQRTDANGNVVENKKFIYEYDKQGNWISKTILFDDQPKFIIERKIEYY